jgi:hemerythrin-like metal-binding protein
MFSFSWKSRYSVGVKDLDRQHQAIMDGLNELHEEMLRGNVNEAVAPLIDQVVSLAGQHFATEEELMESTGFPGLVEHRAKHKELSLKVEEFIARHNNGDLAAYSQFMYFVRDWMTKHMEKEDREYVPWLAEHGIR